MESNEAPSAATPVADHIPELEEASTFPPSPLWGEKAKLLVIAMGFVLGLIGVYLIRNVIAVAALAALIAFLVAPLIKLANTRLHVPRGIALLVAYLVVFVGTLAFGYFLASSIVASIIELDPIGLVDEARVWLLAEADDGGKILVFGLSVDVSGIIAGLAETEGSPGGFEVDAERVLEYLGAGLSGFRTVVGVITAIVTSAIVTVLVAMYLNADSSRMHDGLIEHIPPGYERDGLLMMQSQKRVWRGYLYGQLVNSLITGLLVFAVLWLVGLPGAFLMGAIMVVLNMIPTFGPILAAIPGVLAALISGSTRWPELENFWFALIVAGIYVVVVQLQANIIAPRVMGTAVRLRPAVVLIGLLVGFQVGGLLGSLLAVPVIASIRDVVVYIWAKLTDRDPFPEEAEEPIVSDA
ncbi:MAG: AI-2E family transporter [Acidimicrobiia bacterium]